MDRAIEQRERPVHGGMECRMFHMKHFRFLDETMTITTQFTKPD